MSQLAILIAAIVSADCEDAGPNLAQLRGWEAAAEAACAPTLASLDALEARQVAACRSTGAAYGDARPSCAQSLASLAVRFGGGDHVVHDALVVMDRSVAAGLAFCNVGFPYAPPKRSSGSRRSACLLSSILNTAALSEAKE